MLRLDVQGAATMRKLMPGIVTIFLVSACSTLGVHAASCTLFNRKNDVGNNVIKLYQILLLSYLPPNWSLHITGLIRCLRNLKDHPTALPLTTLNPPAGLHHNTHFR